MRFLLAATLLFALVASCGGHARRSAQPAATARIEGRSPATTESPAVSARAPGCNVAGATGASLRTVNSEGLQRTFRVFVPPSYRTGQLTPVFLNYHGFAGESEGQEWYAGVREAASTHGFIAVTPDGSGNPQRWWQAGERLPGYVDDFAFTRRMLDDLASDYCIDPERIYAAGISNGGLFSSLAACELQDRIAALATVAGEVFPDEACRGKQPTPILVFHGTADATVPFEPAAGRTRLGIPVRSTRESVASWARFNGCNTPPSEQRRAPDIVFVAYEGCQGKADVQLYVVEGGGHNWPGAPAVEVLGHTTQSINATELMWQFFTEHARHP